MAKKKGLPLGTFLKRFSSETQCQEYDIAALEDRVYLPEMWLPSQISAVQRAISVCPMPPSNLGDRGDSAAQDPYAADAVFFGVLFCEPGQAWHFLRSVGGNAWNDL
jgi:hypothetical protein